MSNIENSVITLKNFIEIFNERKTKGDIATIDVLGEEIYALEHILSEREQDKKRINELEEENHIQRSQIMTVYDNGWIPKQKVKDLKESIILGPTIVGGRRNSKTLEYGIKLGKIKACEELLEDK